MTVSFTRTIDDLMYFNLYHFAHSPVLQRQLRVAQVLLGILTTVFTLILAYSVDRDRQIEPPGYIIAVIGGIVFAFIYPAINRHVMKRRLQKVFSEGTNTALLGPQEIHAAPDHLLCQSPAGTSTVYWRSIERTAEDPNYLFFYISTTNAIAIPRSAFLTPEAYHAFLASVQSYRST